jgi:ATP-dependent Clp protease protease subunit
MGDTAELLLKHRIVRLGADINKQTSDRLISELLLLDADDHKAQIDLYINSPGGSIIDGLAIIDAMLCIEAPVSTVCIGQAASMAAWILAAGAKGQRCATPSAEVMIHQASGGYSGQASSLQIYTDRILRLQSRLVEMFSGWTGQTAERIRQDMNNDFFMSSEEAQKYGIIDTILQPFHLPDGATSSIQAR